MKHFSANWDFQCFVHVYYLHEGPVEVDAPQTNMHTSYTIASDSFEYMDPPFQKMQHKTNYIYIYIYIKLHGAIRTDPASEAKHLERSSMPNGRETPESESHRHTQT